MTAIIKNILTFKEMISEQIIKLVYYIGLVLLAVNFVWGFFKSFQNVFATPLALVKLIVGTVLAVLLWRVLCEVILMIFRIYGRLGDINKTLGGKNTNAPIPGDDAINEMREAAMKARQTVADKTSSGLSSAKSAASRAKDGVSEKASSLKGDSKAADQLATAKAKTKPKPVAKTDSPKKAPTRKTAAKKTTTAKKTTAKKTVAKKPAVKKATVKKAAPKPSTGPKKGPVKK